MEKKPVRVLQGHELECDRYDTHNFIARGGFAEVYKVVLNGDGPVAIKYYKPLRSLSCISDDGGGMEEHDSEHSFQQEAQFLWLLSTCPTVVKLEGVQHDLMGKVNAIVMELALGTLNGLIHDDSRTMDVSFPSILTILHDAALAIESTHSAGISHNDIKIDNFLLSSSGVLKLTDYGLSSYAHPHSPISPRSPSKGGRKHLHSPHKPAGASSGGPTDSGGLSLGSLPKVLRKGNTVYQAPELFVAPARYSTACDVYAFGVLLNEVLTRHRPFAGVPGAMLPVQICGGARPSPVYGDDIDAETVTETVKRLRHLVRTCWEGRAKERPTAASVSKTLARLLESEGGERRDEYVPLLQGAR